jgi:hypothetical protein
MQSREALWHINRFTAHTLGAGAEWTIRGDSSSVRPAKKKRKKQGMDEGGIYLKMYSYRTRIGKK